MVDGNYELSIESTKVRRLGTNVALDGDGDGEAGGNFHKGRDPDDKFFAYYGDLNGDGSIGVIPDALPFRAAFGAELDSESSGERYNRLLDFDGVVDNAAAIGVFDAAQFRARFGKSLDRIPPGPADVVAPGLARLMLDEASIDYENPAGEAVAKAAGADISFLIDGFGGVEGDVSGPVSLYDDAGDGEFDGFSVENVVVEDLGSFSFSHGGVTVNFTDATVTIPSLSFRDGMLEADLPSFQFNAASISMAIPGVNVSTEGLAVTFDPNSGNFSIFATVFDLGFGREIEDGNPLFNVSLAGPTLTIDDDPTTDVLSVKSASVRFGAGVAPLDRFSFVINPTEVNKNQALRLNLVDSGGAFIPQIGLGEFSLSAEQGVFASLGLGGILPLDIDGVAIAFHRC